MVLAYRWNPGTQGPGHRAQGIGFRAQKRDPMRGIGGLRSIIGNQAQVASLRTLGQLLVLSEPLSRRHAPVVAALLTSPDSPEVGTRTLHHLRIYHIFIARARGRKYSGLGAALRQQASLLCRV